MGLTGMNRHDSKCAHLVRYKSLAEAQAEAAKHHQNTHAAYPCECSGFHVDKVKPTKREVERQRYDDYLGDFLQICKTLANREVRTLKHAGVRRRKKHVD